jgi:hypothetical protein
MCITAINANKFEDVFDIADKDVYGFRSDHVRESPLYRLTPEFETVSACRLSSPGLLQVLNATYDLIDLVIRNSTKEVNAEDYVTELCALRSEIISFPAVAELDAPSKDDYIYESSRLAALISLSCVSGSRRFLLTPVALVDELISALKRTEVGDNWGNLEGVFYWVSLVGAAATQGRPGKGFADSLMSQIVLHMCYKGYSFESALEAPKQFGRFHCAIAESDPRD